MASQDKFGIGLSYYNLPLHGGIQVLIITYGFSLQSPSRSFTRPTARPLVYVVRECVRACVYVCVCVYDCVCALSCVGCMDVCICV